MATQSQDVATDGGPSGDNYDADETAGKLQARMTAEELRRLAAHSPAVSRSRGADKAQTAMEIAEQDPLLAAEAADGNGFEVSCGHCGLRFKCGHPQTARRAAKEHKSEMPSHFPSAEDEETDTSLYG